MEPRIHHLSFFGPEYGLLKLPKTLRFKGKMANLKQEYCKTWEKRQKDKWYPFHALVAHDCGYPLSRYTCRATRVAADFLEFIAFCRCSTGVALHPLKNFGVAPSPPPCAGRCRTEIWLSEKVSRYTGVSQLQVRVSRYTVQLNFARVQPRALHRERNNVLFFFLRHVRNTPSNLGPQSQSNSHGQTPNLF